MLLRTFTDEPKLEDEMYFFDASQPPCTLRIDSYLRPEAYVGELGVDENLMSDEFWHTLREAGKFFVRTCIVIAEDRLRRF